MKEVEKKDDKKGGRGCGCWIALLVFLLLGGAVTAPLMGQIVLRQETPLPGEEAIADLGVRWLAVPGEFADRRMPDSAKRPENIAKAKALFGAECALCHGATGRGDMPLGQLMYPRAAILTEQRTQSKSDGQLFWIIAHGVNLTGMPGYGKDFGAGEMKGYLGDEDIWNLVSYIRTLKGQGGESGSK